MPDVSLNGIEFVIKGSSDEASDSIDGLVSKLGELANAIKTAFNSAAFGGIGKKAKKETEPLDAALQDLIRNADKATQLKGKLDGLRDSLENAFKAGNEKKAWGIQGQILSTEAALDKFNTTPLTQEMQDLISNASQIDILENKLLSLKDAMQAAFEAGNADKAFGFRAQIIQTEAALEKARAAAEKTAPAIKEVGDSAKKATSPLSSFVASIKRIAFYRMIRAIIKSITEAIKEGAQTFYDFTKRVNPQFTNYAKALNGVKIASVQMKNQLGAAFGSLYTAIAPIITSLISLVTRLANALTMIFARMSGATGWYRAAEGTAANIKDVGGAAKEALKYLAPFDELNRLPSNSGGGGGGSGGNGGGYEWVDFEKFDIGDGIKAIVDWFTESFSNIASWLENIDWQSLGRAFYTKLRETLTSIDWGALASSIFEFLGAALGAAAGFVAGIAEGIWEDIKTAFHELITNDDGSRKTGEEIFLGILEGIHNAITNIGTWISENILGPFVEGFCKAFGIASPAKEMEEPGRMVGEGILAGIAKPFKAIGEWLNEHIVQPIKDFFSGESDFSLPISIKIPEGFEEKLKGIKDAWNKIKTKKAELTAKLKGTKESAFKTLASKWEVIKTKTSELTANLKNNVQTNVIDKLKEGWNAIQNKTATFTANLKNNTIVQKFIDAWNGLKDKALSLKVGISETVRSAWNTVVRKWNGSWLAKQLGTIPELAKGGIVDTPTFIGNAIVGEAGKEAIVPLERNTEWIGMVASGLMTAISNATGGSSAESMENTLYNAFVRALNDTDDNRPIYIDGEPIYRGVVNRNRKETFRTGVNPLMVRG